ncbi:MULTISPECIES: hypothetical protein [unclassified Streptomyces]|uniref:hypothetical protein n=1 Tax=unclassified Streptomyces TaxID=2593676 RepID=UPI00211BC9E3|nr:MULTISPECIES: hypothetical protein [unclassified Streptomyces]
MTATYLRAASGERVSVTVVEPRGSRRSGVAGERMDARVQCNLQTRNPVRELAAEGHYFYPFERPRRMAGFPITDWWPGHGAGDPVRPRRVPHRGGL